MLPQTKKVLLTPPAAIIDNSAVTVAELDTLGFDYCEILVVIGATDIALTVCKVTESDTAGSGHADVTGLVYGTSTNIDGSTSALPAATDDDTFHSFLIDLRGRKRYLDMGLTVGDGTNGAFVTVIALLYRAKEGMQVAADYGCAEVLRV
jgi:hypothetical protein